MKKFIILGIILILAAALRLFMLGHVPASIDWDEASLGYNAYSILLTGKDEFGKSFPIILQSFGDYKPALYVYTVIPFVKLFGLTAFAVRLPSAILGILSVLGVYFLAEELFRNSSLKFKIKNIELGIAEMAAFFMAISPYAIQFSRVAFESNLGLTLNIFGALFFIKGVRKGKFLLLSAVMFALSIYAYQSEKVFVPLLILLLVLVFFRQLWKDKKYLIASAVLGFIILLPMLLFISSNKQALSRAQGVSVFNNNNITLDQVPDRLALDKKSGDMLGEIFDNRRVVVAKIILNNYLSHFDLKWLFLTGDNVARHQPPGMGHSYFFELPLLLLGIFLLFFLPFDKKTKVVLFGWLLITPVAASVTFDVPNAVRVLNYVPVLEIFVAIGTVFALQKLLKLNLGLLLILFFLLFSVLNFVYYLDQYFVQYNYFSAADWQYGYEQTVPSVAKMQNNYQRIVVSDTQPMDQSYIFFLFYLKYPPELYQTQRTKEHDFGKFTFQSLSNTAITANTLYVGTPDNFSAADHVLQTVNYPDGKGAQEIVEGK